MMDGANSLDDTAIERGAGWFALWAWLIAVGGPLVLLALGLGMISGTALAVIAARLG